MRIDLYLEQFRRRLPGTDKHTGLWASNKRRPMSASLIGRSGSSAFRLSTTTVSMSLTGSCFSAESAPRPFHHGIRGRGGRLAAEGNPSNPAYYRPFTPAAGPTELLSR